LRIAGVILNGVGGPRHLEFCQPQIEATTGLPVLGYLPRRPDFEQPERHLGLIPTVEGTVARNWYESLIAQVEETIDVDRIVKLAETAASPAFEVQVYPKEPQPRRAIIAVAQDKAFNFYYQDSLDLLEAWGAEIAPFSPMEDESLPEGASGLYLGGGFPELFAAELSENRPMHDAIKAAVGRGVPVYAECGGLMYLGRSLADFDGNAHPMVGLIPAVSAMSQSRLTLGYREVEAFRRPSAPPGPAGAGPRVPLVDPGAATAPRRVGIQSHGPRRPSRRLPRRQRLGFLRPRPPWQQPRPRPAIRGNLRPISIIPAFVQLRVS
jgi:cobyrinic acid a,c-diamide synthase